MEDGATVDLYVDGILTRHINTEDAQDLAWKILGQVVPEGTEVTVGRNSYCAYGITKEQAEALAPRLVQLWRADSGLGPAPEIISAG